MDQDKVAKLKLNINKLIDIGDIANAEVLVNSYCNLAPNDIDLYSMRSILAFLKNDLIEAERVVLKGLLRSPYNCDLLNNKIYFMELSGRAKEAENDRIKGNLFGCSNDYFEIKSSVKKSDYNKVLLGTMEIANQMNTQASALRSLGINATTVNYYNTYLNYKSDIQYDISKFGNINVANQVIKESAVKMISENDVFHFHFGTTLTLDNSDLSILKKLNKKMIMQYWGSDVRMYSIAYKNNPYTRVKRTDEDKIKRELETISKYISNCLVDFELADYVSGFYENINITRSSIDLNKYTSVNSTIEKKESFLIVHAPSSPEFKGTSFIIDAIQTLKPHFKFDFKLIQGIEHEEALEIYRKADLIIDQLHFGTYGLFAVESMALGKPVICWISDYMKEKLPNDLPIIVANPDTIKKVLKNLLANKDQLSEIGLKGRKYVEKYHDASKIAKEHIEIYKSL